VVFAGGASGTDLRFQWRRDGIDLETATANVLLLKDVTETDAGSYSVAISNTFGVVLSASATLVVDVPPKITVQPWSHTVAVGSVATLSVTASGSPAPAYQWFFNADPVDGAHGPSLILTNFQAGHEGTYHVLATNVLGLARSEDTQLFLDWPLRFLNPAIESNGSFRAQLIGLPNKSTTIEVSSNLSMWLPYATESFPSGIFDLRGTNYSGSTNWFYRARIAGE
jgi:hypothetical protein